MKRSPVSPTVDFEQEGVQHGFLRLPHSRDDSAWGSISIPVTTIKGGEGPTVLLTGANHGDEYEGPIALFDLANRLKADEVTGRVIIVPAMNYPAFRSGTRTSPIDKGNLNRSFPGRPDGTITEKIADYFQRHLLPLADFVLDIHSGGKTLQFVPFAAAHRLADPKQEARCVAAMKAFAAPYSLMLREIDSVGMFDTAAEEMGKVFVSTELGGGGSASATTLAIARRGVRNLLVHAGVISAAPEHAASILLDMPSGDCYVTCETTGLLEMCTDLGSPVHTGQVIARVHDIERTGTAPVEYRAARDGILAGRHFPGLIAVGDTLAVIAVPVP
jgi:N2-acetyl-L-2,4-diaminobutanoate deacetylase